ncbi:transporter substrate-binding domain-containing protein [Tunturibacter empetritectus]|uniref:Polar amino acid transport system substrate-binding protein n=2 Tax=Tunturiibacter empetritectus TaxID=3069691 RepID=A0A7W8IK83_9BACT|nr:transporter substrate-binding domain-containing protein [Edaphobacter lichenicola]MBB5317931.1 polar amino acid transport system substrate-binding protein [Edaphobacter lichenicola]
MAGLVVLLSCALVAQAQETPASPPSPAIPSTSKEIEVPARSTVDMLAEIKKSGKLRVGVSEIVPWAMHDKDGNLVGFEIDVAKKLARDMGVQVEFHPDEFRYLIPDLEANRFDIIVAGFSIEARRALVVNFSQPYNVTDVTIATSKKMGSELKTMEDFNKKGVTIAVVEGTTSEDLAALAFPKASIQTYTEDSALFSDLVAGKLAAAVADSPRLDILAKLYPDAVTVPSVAPLGTFPAAFAVRRGDMDFVNYLNSWIAARNADQWIETRRKYWFKSTDWAGNL